MAGPLPVLMLPVRRDDAGRARVRVELVVRTRDEPVRRAGPCPLGVRRCVVTPAPPLDRS
ncbi:hypothetical protein Ari01nite_34220 [Paractinoplanes rishiriensis]|uniref:Uncharacterized protein n=1 Tax=Paractinoplanes rishiriensis TaxID=1050105 RepID=A0A919JYN8_9ACTN|nr:hypothetical protein Ari01nite_34220 [Actinoplanes rishiriensis]